RRRGTAARPGSSRQLPQRLVMDCHHSFRGLTDALLLAELRGPDDERLAVGLDLEQGVLGDVEQLEDRTFDDERDAVTGRGELLDHGRLVVPTYELQYNTVTAGCQRVTHADQVATAYRGSRRRYPGDRRRGARPGGWVGGSRGGIAGSGRDTGAASVSSS